MKTISSPCILVCSIDEKTGYCFGCGRTSSEIGLWADLSEQQRRAVMSGLSARLETVERKPRRKTRRQARRQARLENWPGEAAVPLPENT